MHDIVLVAYSTLLQERGDDKSVARRPLPGEGQEGGRFGRLSTDHVTHQSTYVRMFLLAAQ